jgi:hypothetical protein
MAEVGVVSEHQRPAPTRRGAAAHDSRLVHPRAPQLSSFWQLDLLVYVVDACSELDPCVRLHIADLWAALLIGAEVGADVGESGDGRDRGCSSAQDGRRQNSQQHRPCCDGAADAGAGAACTGHSFTGGLMPAAWRTCRREAPAVDVTVSRCHASRSIKRRSISLMTKSSRSICSLRNHAASISTQSCAQVVQLCNDGDCRRRCPRTWAPRCAGRGAAVPASAGAARHSSHKPAKSPARGAPAASASPC